MFKIDLYDFQNEHEENLLRKCAEHEEVVLYFFLSHNDHKLQF